MRTLIKTTILAFLIIVCSCSKDDAAINQPPGAFTISSSTVTGKTFKINWTEAIDPEQGEITYNIILEGQTIASTLKKRVFKIEDLEFSKKYTGKIVAYDDEGLTSEVAYNFETEIRPNTAPTAPVLKLPTIGETAVAIKPTLSWNASTDAENDAIVYDVYLDASTNPSTKIAENVSTTSYQVEASLDSESVYYWRVVAKDALNAEAASERGKFATGSLVKALLVTDSPNFKDTYGHTSVVFDDKMWIIGGQRIGGSRLDFVYSSEDGVNWNSAIGSKSFFKRSAHASAVFDNKIWITGGQSNDETDGELSDVWNSEDGATWQRVNTNAQFGGRYDHKMLVFDNKLWILGGRDAENKIPRNQVWNSTDGINWTKVIDDAGVSFRDSEFIVHNNKIWHLGSLDDANIYSSLDGKTWTLEAENAPFGRRFDHTVVQYDDKIWVMSGADAAVNKEMEIPDVWYSEDGKTWKLASSDAGYKAVADHTSVVYDDKIWIIAGSGGIGSNFITNDVYRLEF